MIDRAVGTRGGLCTYHMYLVRIRIVVLYHHLDYMLQYGVRTPYVSVYFIQCIYIHVVRPPGAPQTRTN